jgi:hypothetical protein
MKLSLDNAEKIHYLTLIIKTICEENGLSKAVIIEDFIELMSGETKEKKKLDRLITLQMQEMEFWDK